MDVKIIKRLYKDYTKKHLKKIIFALLLSIAVAGSTSSIAYLLDPAIKEIFMNKDETFFLEDEQLFSAFSDRKVVHFKRLWCSPGLEKDDKDAIWAWFQSFITLAERYQQALKAS